MKEGENILFSSCQFCVSPPISGSNFFDNGPIFKILVLKCLELSRKPKRILKSVLEYMYIFAVIEDLVRQMGQFSIFYGNEKWLK